LTNFFLQVGECVAKGVLSKLNQVGIQLRSKEGKHKKSMGVKGEDGDKAVYKLVFDKLRV
jgi:hypothetical protein